MPKRQKKKYASDNNDNDDMLILDHLFKKGKKNNQLFV